MNKAGDEHLGLYVYCQQHVGPHVTGWCTVNANQKISLKATTFKEAFKEVKSMKLPIYGHCDTCYEWIANGEKCKCP